MRDAVTRIVAFAIVSSLVFVSILGIYLAFNSISPPSISVSKSTISLNSGNSTLTSQTTSRSPSANNSALLKFARSQTVLTDPSTHSFQFVNASVTGKENGSIVISAKFKNNLDVTQLNVKLVGFVFNASVRYISGAPSFGPVCCPLSRLFNTTNATFAETSFNSTANEDQEVKVLFTSLPENRSYFVKLFVTSSNETELLSPVSDLYLQSSPNGTLCGGQEGSGSMLVDPDNDLIYVANSGNDGISVINRTTNALVTTISLPQIIGTLTFYQYDNFTHAIYIGSYDSGFTFVINATTNNLVGEINESNYPWYTLVYDPLNEKIFTANGAVIVISVATNKIVANLSEIQGTSLTYDSGNGDIYIQSANGTLFAISGSNYSIIARIEMPSDYSSNIIYDPDNAKLYFISNNSLLSINTATNSIIPRNVSLPTESNVSSEYSYSPILYDPVNREIFVYGYSMFSIQQNITSNPDRLLAIDTSNNSIVASIPVYGLGGGLVQELPTFFYDSLIGNIYATSILNYSNAMTALLEISSRSDSVISQEILPAQFGLGTTLSFDPAKGILYATGQSDLYALPITGNSQNVSNIELGTCPVFYLLP